ncbi:CgeB family protein [Spirosoma koreense]
MRVVIVGSKLFDSLEYHLEDSLRALGHVATILDVTDVAPVSPKITYWMARFSESYDRTVSQRLANRVVQFHPDLVLVVYRNLHPTLVERIKKRLPDVVVAQINPDALSNLEKQQIIAADFDHYFSKDPYIVDCLRDKAGLQAHYLPEGFNPRVHQKPPVEKFVAEWLTNIDVLVFGSLYAYRARMIEQLIRARVRVAVYGIEGPYLRPVVRAAFQPQYLVGSAKSRLLYGAKVVFNNFHYAEISSVNQKYFEINGVGAFQLCDYKPTIQEYTGVPAEQVTYRTMNEAIDKIRYYLAHASERHELADQQQHHFQQHHTFDHRVAELLQIVTHQSAPVHVKPGP